MRKVFSLGLLIAAMTLIVFPSCKKDKKVTGVKLSETTKSIVVGGEFVLTAIVTPTDAANKAVTWSTDKPAVATVENGKVKGIAVGEATITVTTKDGNKTDKCKVTVTEEPIAVTGVTLSEKEKILKVGEEFTLTATVAPANATNKEVTWTSDKPEIVTVDNNGKVKGVKEGEASITVTTVDGSKKDNCKITVQTKLSSLYKIEVNVDNGETYASIMDSVEAFYWDKDLKTISLQRVPYNNGKFVFELEDTIKNEKLKTIVEYYSSEQIGESAVISDRTALIAPIGIKGTKEGKTQNITFNPIFKVDGAMFSSGIYIHSDKNCNVTMDKQIGQQNYVFKLKLVRGYNLIQTIQYVENGVMKTVYTTEQQGKLSWSVWK